MDGFAQSAWLWLGSAALTAVVMELWAACLHRFVWHTWLWPVHRSHHAGRGDIAAPHPRTASASTPRWQANDVLSLVHAPIAVTCILYGCLAAPSRWRELIYGVGIGMTAFGIAYVLIHDGLAHNRLPLRALLRWRYLRRVRAAHRLHHCTGQAPFGLFLGPWTQRKPARSLAVNAGTRRSSPGRQRDAPPRPPRR